MTVDAWQHNMAQTRNMGAESLIDHAVLSLTLGSRCSDCQPQRVASLLKTW
jgi:hypothetical protein